MKASKKLLAIAAVPFVFSGWLLFRPELLFVNHEVNEKLPMASNGKAGIETLAEGKFTSYAHESTGTAQTVKVDGKTILRLSDFKTSNGPDVHVYLVAGTSGDADAVKNDGFLDLGTIKGNIGDQNYDLPSDIDLAKYKGVAIWCKRFGVDFAGAALESKSAMLGSSTGAFHLAGWNPAGTDEIKVTGGSFAHSKGTASIIEKNGARFLRIEGLGAKKGLHILLVKAESATDTMDVQKASKVDLGVLNGKSTQTFPVAKDIDAWLYRSVSLWDRVANKSLSIALLRSDQETQHTLILL